MKDGPGKVLLDSTPSRIYPFSHYICFLLFVFCLLPYRVLSPRILEENRNTAPRGREGGAHSGVHFLLEAILLSKEMASVDLELSSFALFIGTVFCVNVTVALVYLLT